MSFSPLADESGLEVRPSRWKLPQSAWMALTALGTLLVVAMLLQMSQTLRYANVGRRVLNDRIPYSRVEEFLSTPVPLYPGSTLISGPGNSVSITRTPHAPSTYHSNSLRWHDTVFLDVSDLSVQQIEQLCPFYAKYLESSGLGFTAGGYSYRANSAYDTVQGHPVKTAYGYRQIATAEGSSAYGWMMVHMEVREATGSPMTRDEFVRMAAEYDIPWTMFDKHPTIPQRIAVVEMRILHTNVSLE